MYSYIFHSKAIKYLVRYQTIPGFNDHDEEDLKRKKKKNILRKGENAGDQHFLLFSQHVFLPLRRQIKSF